jgi:galactokinase
MALDPQQLARDFERCFGSAPQTIVRAPGRVNLIGEHTDYSLLPVLPIAIDRATLVGAAADDSGQVIARSLLFEGEARVERSSVASATADGWHRYLIGALRELEGTAPGRGARILLGGDLPTTGGLSSSSSLTMGLLAALDAVWQLGLAREELVRRGIVAERHVGVESGGMDQTVIGLAQAGAALRIGFSPASRAHVPLPLDLALVVAFSGEEAPKGGSVRQAYNERVVGCRLAASLLARELGVAAGDPPVLASVANGADVKDLVEQLPERSSAAAVAARLGVDPEPLVRLTAGRFDDQAEVLVRAVARHVLGEAERVDQTEQALRDGDLARVGAHLDASHHSLAEDFRCSTPALDRVCDAMRRAGAHGARLTGAGFGGYTVAALSPERVTTVIAAAVAATGGPAFEVHASVGLTVAPAG